MTNPLLFSPRRDDSLQATRIQPLFEPEWPMAEQHECDAGWASTDMQPLEHRLTTNQRMKLAGLLLAFKSAYRRIIHQGS